jgi:hypothetical protein
LDDFESLEVHSGLREGEDYPARVQYCEHEVARHPGDHYVNERLASTYVLNGQYLKAIDSMGACHRKHPGIEDFLHGRALGFEFYGVGIHNDYIRQLLPDASEVITNLDELVPSMFRLLKRTLTNR